MAQREGQAPWKNLRGRGILGGDHFVAHMQERLHESSTTKEIPRVDRFVGRRDLARIFTSVKDKTERDYAIYHAYVKPGHTQSEISSYL